MTTTTKKTEIVWNGCDGYVAAADADRLGYDFDGKSLYHGSKSFQAFIAEEVAESDVPLDEDGEPDYDGLAVLPYGRVFRVR
jgi:hypothetical protein